MALDSELERLRSLKMERLRLGLEKPEAAGKAPSVEVYSTPSCPYCHMAKQYLTSRNVPFKDIDVTRDRAAGERMVSQTGQAGVPQLYINGKWVIGFDRASIDAALTL
ncbi:MAG: glutaredoxin family protein [Candidatus Micrarchaeota archaeon]